jgi:soluble lytic murein transglycosylase
MKWASAATLTVVIAILGAVVHAQEAAQIVPTVHPPLPDSPAGFWFVPASFPPSTNGGAESALDSFARGVKLIEDGKYTAGLPLVSASSLSQTVFAAYAQFYRAVALAGTGRQQEAANVLISLVANEPEGYVREAAALRLADLEVALQDAKRAVLTLEDLKSSKAVTAPEDLLMKLGRAAESAGDRDKAIQAYRKVYYESPLTPESIDAQDLLGHLDTSSLSDRFKPELARAGRLFDAHRYAPARAGFEPLASLASGDDKELIQLRLAECDFYLDRYRQARDRLTPLLEKAPRAAEARFFYLSATRSLGDNEAFVAQVRALSTDYPDSSWTLEALNSLASYYVVQDDDASADGVFRELFARFPDSKYGERAAWKIGWWAYKNGKYADAAQAFDAGAATFPRADTRPAWLYWSGRAHDQIGDTELANDRYRVEVEDYGNSYYGRLASKILDARHRLSIDPNITVASTAAPGIPTAELIRQLVAVELYDPALKELAYAKLAWGDSPPIEATTAWIRHEQAQHETAPERFDHLRGAINVMKRAYPQYLAAGGEGLPPAVLEVIYPLDYWPLIHKYSEANDLDPYLMAALVAQESTFTADVRSGANAIGLMQLVPSTGRLYARRLHMPFTNNSLLRPETNIQIGMAYFKELSTKFGGTHYALAGYNAGDSRVAQWMAERPGISQDEFVDDIPFPETQQYVKRILGTAEDYRRLYGGGLLEPGSLKNAPPVRTSLTPLKRKPAKKAPVRRASVRKAPAKKTAR